MFKNDFHFSLLPGYLCCMKIIEHCFVSNFHVFLKFDHISLDTSKYIGIFLSFGQKLHLKVAQFTVRAVPFISHNESWALILEQH